MTISSGMPMRSSASRLEGGRVDVLGPGERVEVEIDQRRGDELDRGEALVEGARGDQLVDQRLRHRLAGACSGGRSARRTSGRSSQCS